MMVMAPMMKKRCLPLIGMRFPDGEDDDEEKELGGRRVKQAQRTRVHVHVPELRGQRQVRAFPP